MDQNDNGITNFTIIGFKNYICFAHILPAIDCKLYAMIFNNGHNRLSARLD